MINSVAGYEMVDVTGLGRFVTGGILPVREGGARRALKYEDLLFLMEGKLERQNWTLAANTAAKASKAAAPGRFLRTETFGSALCRGVAISYYYRDKEKEITEGITAAGSESGGSDTRDYARALNQIVGDEVTLEMIEIGRALKSETLEKAYENMGKLKRTLDRIEMNELWQGRRSRWHARDWRDRETYGPWGEDYTRLYEYGGATDHAEVHEFEETTGSKQYPYAKNAWLVLFVNTRRGPDWDATQWLDAVTIKCAVDRAENGQPATVRWPALSSGTVAQAVLASHGETYRDGPTKTQQGTESQSVTAEIPYLLVEHEFPASEPEGI